jgi:hypothetical protein
MRVHVVCDTTPPFESLMVGAPQGFGLFCCSRVTGSIGINLRAYCHAPLCSHRHPRHCARTSVSASLKPFREPSRTRSGTENDRRK